MVKVEAIYPFEHDGSRKRGDVFEVSERHAELLQKRGLVRAPQEKAEQQKPAPRKPTK